MPEKRTHQIPASLRELYEKGMQAIERQNLDYAITILSQVLEKEPGFYDAREALRAAQFKRAAAGTGFFRKAFSKASASPLLAKAQLGLHSNPLDAIRILEQVLNADPQSVTAHKMLAEAALAADLTRTAVLSFEIAHKHSPRDRNLVMRLAEALAQAGQVARGEQLLTDLLNANPDDLDIAQALKDIAARRTMQEGGYDSLESGEGSYRDILRDREQSVALEQEQREVKTEDVASNLIREYEDRLRQEPSNLRLIRSLAELYNQKKDFDAALLYYQKLQAASLGADPSLDRAITDTKLRKLDLEIEQLDPQVPDYEAKVAQLRAQQQDFKIQEAKKQVDKYPTDLQLRFDLGQLYYEAGRISEAIQEFQKAQANPHRRVPSLHYLGLCFSQRGMNDLAARTLQNALKEKLSMDDEKKDLLYALGGVFDKMQKAEEAIEQYKQIYEVDIGYRDVAAKVDTYYSKS